MTKATTKRTSMKSQSVTIRKRSTTKKTGAKKVVIKSSNVTKNKQGKLDQQSFNIKLSVDSTLDINKREYMEDFLHTQTSLPIDKGQYSLFVICDGHGGEMAARFLSTSYTDRFVSMMKNKTYNNVAQCMKGALQELETDWTQTLGQTDPSGSTAVICVIDSLSEILFLINIGDSKALLVDMENPKEILLVTKDHDLEKSASRKEVQKRSNSLGPCQTTHAEGEPWRINDNLAMARSFGDLGEDLAGCIGKEPDLYTFPLESNHTYKLVMASDGLFDELSITQVVKTVSSKKRNTVNDLRDAATTCAKQGDNIAVISVVIST